MTGPNTPPADDVREALAALGRLATGAEYAHDIRLVRAALERLELISSVAEDDVRKAIAVMLRTEPDANLVTDALLAAFEVRPRGTVTDAEVLRAKAAALTEFADAVRMPFTVFRGDSGEPITPGDLMRETAARYLAEAEQGARS
ncbi:hypothetical protein B0I12_002238 [Microbacterium hydrothermale]|uniref:hypothetical protein n=1 Tax=Microbacterium hydrothermale TaxID=857427 RepID=UPI002226646E|nr:hypothetical protein [Microbacterium hydrothermale]MCW2165083.1 hypothetical protein [Microbacterium hydrothermale]